MTDFELLDNLLSLSSLSTLSNNQKEERISEEISSEEACPHKNIFEDGITKICGDCGYEIASGIFEKEWGGTRSVADANRCYMRKIDDRSIFRDVYGMGFNENIITSANNLYLQVTNKKIFRGNSRKGIIVACIFHSYKNFGTPQSYESLISIFGIDKNVGLKGLKYVNLYAPKDSPIRTTYITTANLIDELLDKFSVSEDQKKEVQELYIKIKNKSSILNRSRPQSLAASLIWYWCCQKGKNLNIKDYVKKVNLSELTINKITKEIERVIPDSLNFKK